MVLKVDYLIVSNGLKHYCCRIDYEHNSYIFLQDIPDIKAYWKNCHPLPLPLSHLIASYTMRDMRAMMFTVVLIRLV